MSDNWTLGLLTHWAIPCLRNMTVSNVLLHFRNQPFCPLVPLGLPTLAWAFHVVPSAADFLRMCPSP
eukprot:12931217-Prorocentrum_lima.AAC.1